MVITVQRMLLVCPNRRRDKHYIVEYVHELQAIVEGMFYV